MVYIKLLLEIANWKWLEKANSLGLEKPCPWNFLWIWYYQFRRKLGISL